MALLQMIQLQHHWEPHLARRGVRRGALVRKAGPIVALEARNPRVDRGAGALQQLTDTALTPTLRIEGDDLQASLGALGMAVVVQERPRGRSRWRGGFPKAARRLGGGGVHRGV